MHPRSQHGREVDPPGGRERSGDGEQDLPPGYRPNVNQARHEPLPASHDDERWQEAVQRNQEHSHAMTDPWSPSKRGRAVLDLTPSEAQPAPDEPAAQVTAARDPQNPPGDRPADDGTGDDSAGRPAIPGRVRRVTRAVPGRPDGEVNPGR